MYPRLIGRLVLAASLVAPTIARAQGPAGAAIIGRVAVLDVALYTGGANLQESTDTAVATLATQVLGGKLRELLGASVLDSVLVGRATRSDSARSITGGGKACKVIVACARYVGTHSGRTGS